MSMDRVPLWAIFLVMTLAVVIAIELGHRLYHYFRRHCENEKESSVSTIAGSTLGLLAFILAFTFGIVADRYDSRKALVREEANAIGTTYLRSDFMSEPDRSKTVLLLKAYVDSRLVAAQSHDHDQMQKAVIESGQIQRQLWDMAVVNARKDMNSDVAALYIDSLNNVIDIHALRVAVGMQARIPAGIWVVLCVLVLFSMVSVGYQTAIAGSTTRSWPTLILAVSFSLVIMLIASLDRPKNTFMTVSQKPLVDVRASMVK